MSAQMSDRQALRSLLGCVAAVAALVVAVVAINAAGAWPTFGKGVGYVFYVVAAVGMVAFNLLSLVALPILCAAGVGFLVSLCLLGKGFDEYPGEDAAHWRLWMSENLETLPVFLFLVMFFTGMPALLELPQGGDSAISSYSKVVSTPRADLESVEISDYTVWRSLMVKDGVVERRPARPVCQKLLEATPVSSPYLLTVNGRPAGEAKCSWGPNHLVWREK